MLPAKSDAIANSRKGPPYAFLTLNSYASQCEDGKSVNEWIQRRLSDRLVVGIHHRDAYDG